MCGIAWQKMDGEINPVLKRYCIKSIGACAFSLEGGIDALALLVPSLTHKEKISLGGWHDEYSRDNGDNVRTTVSQTVLLILSHLLRISHPS